MKFGHIFISINLFIDHQASGAYLTKPQINNHARPNVLPIHTASDSSGVVYSLTDEHFAKKMYYANKMRLQADRDSHIALTPSTMSQWGHRGLGQELDSQSTATPPMQKSEIAQAPSTTPRRRYENWGGIAIATFLSGGICAVVAPGSSRAGDGYNSNLKSTLHVFESAPAFRLKLRATRIWDKESEIKARLTGLLLSDIIFFQSKGLHTNPRLYEI
ncbi:hypothetical protein DFH28DRAFT_1104123 [Melampsora americana]|nr:hypothetical protein DFH28DRAFT_1104123 [Melampsora americana]